MSFDRFFSAALFNDGTAVEAPKLLDDGWIPWGGGECPIADVVRFRVKFRNGIISGISHIPTSWRWSHDSGGGDIIAYRLIYQPKQQQPTPDPHAELKAQYALDDAALNGKGWRVWQVNIGNWLNLTVAPFWSGDIEYRRHPNADAMIEYIQGGENPAEWEWTWGTQVRWFTCDDIEYQLDWRDKNIAIRRRETIVVNGIEINAPMAVKPQLNDVFFIPSGVGCSKQDWSDTNWDKIMFDNGLCFKTKQEADAFWEAYTAPGRDYVAAHSTKDKS
jgi:hypothetical protein